MVRAEFQGPCSQIGKSGGSLTLANEPGAMGPWLLKDENAEPKTRASKTLNFKNFQDRRGKKILSFPLVVVLIGYQEYIVVRT